MTNYVQRTKDKKTKEEFLSRYNNYASSNHGYTSSILRAKYEASRHTGLNDTKILFQNMFKILAYEGELEKYARNAINNNIDQFDSFYSLAHWLNKNVNKERLVT